MEAHQELLLCSLDQRIAALTEEVHNNNATIELLLRQINLMSEQQLNTHHTHQKMFSNVTDMVVFRMNEFAHYINSVFHNNARVGNIGK